MNLKLKTLLNATQPLPGFIYEQVRLLRNAQGQPERIEVDVAAHRQRPAHCSRCNQPAPGYDHLPQRSWLHVPCWNIPVWLRYAPRRVACPQHGVVVEALPWNQGQRQVTLAMMVFLARWARRLSWRETARACKTSWDTVYRAIAWVVQWGLAQRELTSITAVGVDEIHWGHGKKADSFLTVIYQLDAGCRRLLWVGRRRTQRTLRKGLESLGPVALAGIRYACSDMWAPYRAVIASLLPKALHVLDRFHITQLLNQAVDQTRRAERHKARQGPRLKHMRWALLRKGSRLRGRMRAKLQALLQTGMATAKAYLFKETLDPLWKYHSPSWAALYLEVWIERARRCRIPAIQRVAKTLAAHAPLIINWFRAKGELSTGAVEGLNNKIRVVTRRSYGFRTYQAMETALYHNLGRLPEPKLTHDFC